jgi:glycosyltransferase involved in cell wall biosynthesis
MAKTQKTTKNEVGRVRAYSAVIPTIGREETLPMVLMSLVHQTNTPIEVVILDEAKKPVSENYCVNQALDVLSLMGVRIKVLRNRRKQGIGAARLDLAQEARNPFVLMLDDDVVLAPSCAEELINALIRKSTPWAVPTCVLVPANFAADGYRDTPVDITDPSIQMWTQKYPWFIPYFQYMEPMECLIPCSGTQAILLRKKNFLSTCSEIGEFGRLPREDTYMTTKMGPGVFTSKALCHHFEHPSQAERSNWGTSMFYKLHEACMENPDAFLNMIRR